MDILTQLAALFWHLLRLNVTHSYACAKYFLYSVFRRFGQFTLKGFQESDELVNSVKLVQRSQTDQNMHSGTFE